MNTDTTILEGDSIEIQILKLQCDIGRAQALISQRIKDVEKLKSQLSTPETVAVSGGNHVDVEQVTIEFNGNILTFLGPRPPKFGLALQSATAGKDGQIRAILTEEPALEGSHYAIMHSGDDGSPEPVDVTIRGNVTITRPTKTAEPT